MIWVFVAGWATTFGRGMRCVPLIDMGSAWVFGHKVIEANRQTIIAVTYLDIALIGECDRVFMA